MVVYASLKAKTLVDKFEIDRIFGVLEIYWK